MLSYTQLKASNDAQWWNLKIQFTGEWESSEQPMTFERTATNKASLTVGLPYYMWRGIARLYYTPPDASYTTIAQFKKWSMGGISERTMQMRDHLYQTNNTTYNVIFVSKWLPQYLSPVFDGAGSYWLAPFEIYQA